MAGDWARPIVHWEIVARDLEVQSDFYRQLFHWDISDGPFAQVGAGLGGPEPGPAGHIRAGAEPAVVLYVQVGDLSATLARARGWAPRSRPIRSICPAVPPSPSSPTQKAMQSAWCSSSRRLSPAPGNDRTAGWPGR